MNPSERNVLSRLGLSTKTINGIELAIELLEPFQELDEKDPVSKEINKKIREKYSLSQELAIVRQKTEKPKEFDEFVSYVEQCKREVKEQHK